MKRSSSQKRYVRNTTKAISWLLVIIFSTLYVPYVEAAVVTSISDTISTSAPSTSANHTIQFTTATEIPASGKIIITPQTAKFTIPAGLNYTDVDLKDDSTDLTLDSSAGTGADSALGVSVTTGTSGSITFTLNDTDAVASSSVIAIEIGANAEAGETGDVQITNPSSVTSYTISVETQNSSSATLDEGTAMIAIVDQVSASSEAGEAEEEAEVVIESVTVGGLGGAPQDQPLTSVIFEGQAPPESTVFILKEGEVTTSTLTGGDEEFSVLLKNIRSAIYDFSIYIIDRVGRISSPVSLETPVPLGKTTEVKDIIIPPTISIEKEKVDQGESVVVRGESIPNQEVLVKVESREEPIGMVRVDEKGKYEFEIPTLTLAEGLYAIQTQVKVEDILSLLSSRVEFQVIVSPVVEVPEEPPLLPEEKPELPPKEVEPPEEKPERPVIEIPEEVKPEPLPEEPKEEEPQKILDKIIYLASTRAGSLLVFIILAILVYLAFQGILKSRD